MASKRRAKVTSRSNAALPTHEVKIRVPLVWKRLINVDFYGMEGVTSEKHLNGIGDPDPHYDDARRINGRFPDGTEFSLELCSGQSNYYGGLYLMRGNEGLYAEIIEEFEDAPGSNRLSVQLDGPERFVFHIEWTGTDSPTNGVSKG